MCSTCRSPFVLMFLLIALESAGHKLINSVLLVCRWGYQTLSAVEEVVSAYSAAQIPLEVIWTDIDYSE